MEGFWKDRNVFITGCTGFLGSWLTIALVELGANVIGLVRDWFPRSNLNLSGFAEKITIVRGSVTDYELIERSLVEYEIDTCFHLAAQTIVTIAERAPLPTFETNIRGTWILLEAARRCPTVERVLISSSDKAYGEQDKLPYTEDMPLAGRHPYEVSKSCADLIASSYAKTYGMPIGITRFCNIYGGGDLNWSRIVPGTIRSVLRGERPIIRSDGTLVRDYIYVKDVTSAYILLAERLDDPSIKGQAFNFGLDEPKSVLEIVREIIEISDYPDLEPIILRQELKEIKRQYLSSEKARKLLGWRPNYTFREGLKETMEWYRRWMGSLGI
jgi:CDP-glucose 4,6-dehydratase